MKYEVVKSWVTGERAEQLEDEDEIGTELETLMRQYMEHSGQRKFFGHRTNLTDKELWKLGRSHTDKRGITYDVNRCPMLRRCSCEVRQRLRLRIKTQEPRTSEQMFY